MQYTTELGVDEPETMLHCFKYQKKPCHCNMQIGSSLRFWDMEEDKIPLYDNGHLFTQVRANNYLYGLISVSARIETTG